MAHADQYSSEAGAKRPYWAWGFRILKAEAQRRQYDPQKALDTLKQEPPAGMSQEIYVRRNITLASANCQLSRWSDANSLFPHAASLTPADRIDLIAEREMAQGVCAIYTNDMKVSYQFFEQATEHSRTGDPFVAATSLVGSAYALEQTSHFDQAVDRLILAARLTDSPFIREKALGNLGNVLLELAEYRRSINASDQAQKLAATVGRDDDREAWLVSLGNAHITLLELAEAEPYIHEALAIARRLHDQDMEFRALNNLTNLYLLQGKIQKAHETQMQEMHLVKNSDPLSAYAIADGARIAYAENDLTSAEQGYRKVMASPIARQLLRSIAQRELGRIFERQNKFQQAEQMFRQSIDTAEKAVCAINEQHRLSYADSSPFYDAYILFLIHRKNPLQALQISERGRAHSLLDCTNPTEKSAGFNLKTVQASLKRRREILLTYWVMDEQSYLWVITPSQLRLFPLPKFAELGRQQEVLNNEIQSQRKLEESPGAVTLYQSLIAPAAEAGLVPKGSHVIVVPSRILCLVNFETLIVPGANPRYWVEDVEIKTASSIAPLLRQPHKPSNAQKELLLVGNPSQVTSEFPALKHAESEMKNISARFPAQSSLVLAGAEASPQTYLASNPSQFRLIHFVTHGTANELVPMESAIILSGPQSAYKLYGRDILSTKLSADLVTISACYGAGKRWYMTEATVGLEWAFLRAGAHQVIAAMWEVDDAITPKLMDDLYSHLSSRDNAAAALRAAKLSMLRTADEVHKRPYYWASLQLYTN